MSDRTETPAEQFGEGLLEHLLNAVRTLEQTVSRQSDIVKSLARRVADLEDDMGAPRP